MKRYLLLLTFILLSSPLLAATHTVTNCADSGAGSLRYAVASAETDGGGLITFNITTEVGYATPEGSGWVTNEASGAEWFRIVLNDPISFSNNISIEGSSQSTDEVDNPYGPEIEIRSGGSAIFYISGNNGRIDHLVLNSSANGILIANGNNNTVTGCYLGTTASGEAQRANIAGIYISGGNYNTIGGTSAGERNIISGNTQYGIYISDANSNEVYGNYIGFGADGETLLSNTMYGIFLFGTSQWNRIGTSEAGGGNVIVADTGIYLKNADVTNNFIYNNIIGLTSTESLPSTPGQIGIYLYNGASNNQIGGPLAGESNVISGNSTGIWIDSSDNNKILGNYIGTDSTGTAAGLGNTAAGIRNRWGKYNKIGDGTSGGRNIISGSGGYGIHFNGTDTNSNEVLGNYIGVDATGTSTLENASGGIYFTSDTQFNRIGSSESGHRNIISGNKGVFGVKIESSSHNYIEGNWIGLGTDESAVPNDYGIWLSSGSPFNLIISNVVSGNSIYGIDLEGVNTNSNEVRSNFIGTDPSGTSAIANTTGLRIGTGGRYNIIGGETTLEGNVISGNSGYGVFIASSTTRDNILMNNTIGLNSSRNAKIPNIIGINLSDNDYSNQIGASGMRGNTISGNNSLAIQIQNCSGTHIIQNIIGSNPDFDPGLGNGAGGIDIGSSSNVVVGGNSSLEANFIVGNGTGEGIAISGGSNNAVRGNYIGVTPPLGGPPQGMGNKGHGIVISDSNGNVVGSTVSGGWNSIGSNEGVGINLSGTAEANIVLGNNIGLAISGGIDYAFPNVNQGIYLDADSNTIGTTEIASAGRNVISNNTFSGIHITGDQNEIYGNLIGVSSTGQAAAGNLDEGIVVSGSGNVIGGTGGRANIISGNKSEGIMIGGASATSNEVSGNIIGLNAAGTAAISNETDGVRIYNGAGYNVIGGATAAAGNIISGNSDFGLYLLFAGTGNVVRNNIIGVDIDQTYGIPNTSGIYIYSSEAQQITGNVISGNAGYGITVGQCTVGAVSISQNTIGTNTGGTLDLGNGAYGIYSASKSVVIGGGNIIAYNGSVSNPEGILINSSLATNNVITQNSIFANYGKGIGLDGGANPSAVTPEVITADHYELTGLTRITGESAPANGTVEVFMAEGNQGKTYLGSTEADGDGNWTIYVSGLTSGDAIVATGTSVIPETSEFSLSKEVITTEFKEYQPDNMIATLETYADITGEAIFNTNGNNQTRTRVVASGASATYHIKIENEANTTDEVIVKGRGSSGSWALAYYDAKSGGNNITASITGSGWSTGTLASGESKEIRMVVSNSGTALATLESLVTSESKTQTVMKDAVKSVTTVLAVPTDLTSFTVSGPATAIAAAPFSLTVKALKSTGATEEVIIGTTGLSVDSGTISPESIAASAFTSGLWTGNVTLSKAGPRKITAKNGSSVGTAEIVVLNAAKVIISGGVTISVPAGAASEEVSITVSEVTSPGDPSSGYMLGGKVFDIDATPGEFLLPITVTIPINGPLVDPRVYYWTGTKWSNEGITIVSYTDTSLTFTTTHCTVFAPMAAAPDNYIRFGPNPYNPNSGTPARIWYWLDADAATSIYVVNMAGTLVWKNSYAAGLNGGRKDSNSIDFDGRDRWGSLLGDGVYIYKIVQDGKSIGGGKIAIIK